MPLIKPCALPLYYPRTNSMWHKWFWPKMESSNTRHPFGEVTMSPFASSQDNLPSQLVSAQQAIHVS